MITAQCPNCGEPVAALAKNCGHCGSPNRVRGAVFAVLGCLLVLFAAIGTAMFAVVRWQRLSVGTAEFSATATNGDFGWLTDAMKDCDADAEKAASALHFLVIHL